jgi:hypothetical protein
MLRSRITCFSTHTSCSATLLSLRHLDLAGSHDIGGFAKALWVIILPFLGVLVYLIARGGKMHERAADQAAQQQKAFDQYVKQAPGRRVRGPEKQDPGLTVHRRPTAAAAAIFLEKGPVGFRPVNLQRPLPDPQPDAHVSYL